MSQNAVTELKAEILHQADRCVKCGLCSAQCPTYLVDQSENESPRGRISLMQAIASDQLPITPRLTQSIENCLSCYRCEKICPSGVQFGAMLATTRYLLNRANPNFKKEKLIKWVSNLSFKKWKILANFIWACGSYGVFRFLPQLNAITNHLKPAKYLPIRLHQEKKVFLFTGCTSQLLDAQTINSAQQLLSLCGYSVIMPAKQVCCGALAYHKGYLEIAQQCHEDNRKAFNDSSMPILFLATACGAELKKTESSFSTQAIDIVNFLVDNNLLNDLKLTSINKRILIHSPCSEKNMSNTTNTNGRVEQFLSHIPNIEIITMKESTSCCGAAGDYMVHHVEKSQKIRGWLIDNIESIKPDIIVTNNYTCGIQLKNGLKEKNLDIAVMHPIELLLRQVDSHTKQQDTF